MPRLKGTSTAPSQHLHTSHSLIVSNLTSLHLVFLVPPWRTACPHLLCSPRTSNPAASQQMPHLLPHREAGNLTFLLYIQTLIRPQHLGPSSGREHLSFWLASRAHTPASWGPGAAHLPSPGASPALPLSQLPLRSSDLPPPPPHLPFAPRVTQVRLLPRQVPRNCSDQQLAVTCGPARPSPAASLLSQKLSAPPLGRTTAVWPVLC